MKRSIYNTNVMIFKRVAAMFEGDWLADTHIFYPGPSYQPYRPLGEAVHCGPYLHNHSQK